MAHVPYLDNVKYIPIAMRFKGRCSVYTLI